VVLELLMSDDSDVVVSLREASMVPFTMQEAHARWGFFTTQSALEVKRL